ncbi:hypothetical protein GCM10011374_26590 [Kocuria dechangensis]|uniref:Uncharacterized protein n=1 Tax=Kocuria dechangensis TaxID=1176249 RepID=A0A917GZT9_9MICC|nr:hypothetical protein [Kocuria dechangensis]GGG62143.1 hypothetical protein GCM10011374_26590 [Kocuria dechangensis]
MDKHLSHHRAGDHPTAPGGAASTRPRRLRALWNSAMGGMGAVLGLLPHVLHHVGVLAGMALIAGSGGTLVFGVLGLAASVPLLLRLRRRFGTWWAPAVGLLVFAALYSLSAFVIGPLISGSATVDVPGGEESPAPSHNPDHTAGH